MFIYSYTDLGLPDCRAYRGYDLGQKYYAPQVQPDRGLNS